MWPQLLVLKLTVPGCPNSKLYVLSDGTTPVEFPIMCELYDAVKMVLFRLFYPLIGEFGWAGPESTINMVTCHYCMFEVDSSLSALHVNMIGPLAKFVRASNSFKIITRYFGKV